MARRGHKAWFPPVSSDDRPASMVSEPYTDETDGVGDDPEDDRILDSIKRIHWKARKN